MCLLATSVSFAQGVSGDETTSVSKFEDGTFIVNEGWFGHDGGSINFITADGDVEYNVERSGNENLVLGNTSCYGIVYGGKLYVMSKQANGSSGSEENAGGRLVVFDAKTLNLVKSFDNIGGGDGRSIVGVNPHKIYLGTTAGVVVLDVDKMEVGDVIQGIGGQDSRNLYIGDMVKAGRYVFVVEGYAGVHVIDTETDMLVETISDTNVQGITQSSGGNVWMASTSALTCIDPATLDVKETQTLPDGVKIMCQWGSWKPTAFCASRTKNVLYWNQGGSWTNGDEFYRYEIGTDITALKPFFTIDGLPSNDEGCAQVVYGTARYDDRTDRLVILTTQSGYGTNYEHNWVHFVNGTAGELEKTITMKQGYWFPELPVFPDKYAPEFVGVENSIELAVNGLPHVVNLAGKVTDQDNLSYNITTTLADAGNAAVATTELDGTTLTVAPVAEGSTKIVLMAESNGVVTEFPITVTVGTSSGINGVGASDGTATEMARFTLDGKRLDAPQPGVNIVHMSDGTVRKVVVKQ